jgi:hypothetical protein
MAPINRKKCGEDSISKEYFKNKKPFYGTNATLVGCICAIL